MWYIVLGVVLTLICVGFSIWYIWRTPRNLKAWYNIPVIVLNALMMAGIWFLIWSIIK